MAELYRFFDSVSDRYTTAAQMNRIFDQILQEKDGVIRGLANTLEVTNAGTLSADINTGSCVMGGRLYENTASVNKALDAVTSGSKRYDRIVVRVDETARTMVLTVIKGVEGASPSVPAIDGSTDVLLAKILVDRSSGSYVYTVTNERVYCDGLLLPSIIALLNAGTNVVPTAAGATDANAIAAATGATLYARLFGILDATWGNGAQPPAPKGTLITTNTVAGVAKTIFTLAAAPGSDGVYLVSVWVPGGNASYVGFGMVAMDNGNATAFFNRAATSYYTIGTDGAYAVQITSNTIGDQGTVKCILTKLVGA